MTILKGTVPSLVTRLRTMAGIGWNPIGDEAADRIEELEYAIRNAVHYCDVREGQYFMDELAALLTEDRE